MRSLRLSGQDYPMSGLLPQTCTLTDRRAALGYRAPWPCRTGQPPPKPPPPSGRGDTNTTMLRRTAPCPPPAAISGGCTTAPGGLLREEGCRLGSVAGSWMHCYPEGSRRFWRTWLRALPPI